MSGEEREKALRTVLVEARRDDGFSLWHLLARVSDVERPRVYDRLAELVRAPRGTTREGTLRLDPKMMDLWWNQFHLGDIEIWRFWERNEEPVVKKAAR